MSAPLIGVTVGDMAAGARTVDGADSEYQAAVARAGGCPVLVPGAAAACAGSLVEHLDGVVLSGGGDVDPGRYRARPHAATGGVDPRRDRMEMAVLDASLRAGKPVLAICRGCQVVNVHFGGTLHQHLPEVTASEHLHPEPRSAVVHQVEVEPGSRLADILGAPALGVNSIHHQGIDRLGASLRPVARSADGLVEAVESPEHDMVAVQWHPESLVASAPDRDALHLGLFVWLVGAAADRRAGARA